MINYKYLTKNYITTEQFIDELEKLGFQVLEGVREDGILRIVSGDGSGDGEFLVAYVRKDIQYKVYIYFDNFLELRWSDEWEYDSKVKLINKFYYLLYCYAATPIELRSRPAKEAKIIDYDSILENYITTEEFIKELADLGIKVIYDPRGKGCLRISLSEDLEDFDSFIAYTRQEYQFRLYMYLDHFYKLLNDKESNKDNLIAKIYYLLYSYASTPEDER